MKDIFWEYQLAQNQWVFYEDEISEVLNKYYFYIF